MNRKILPFLMPLRSIIFIAVFIVISMIAGRSLSDISNTWSVTASAVNIIAVTALIFITKNDGGLKKLINYEKGKTAPKQAVGMSVLILFLGMLGMYLAGLLLWILGMAEVCNGISSRCSHS